MSGYYETVKGWSWMGPRKIDRFIRKVLNYEARSSNREMEVGCSTIFSKKVREEYKHVGINSKDGVVKVDLYTSYFGWQHGKHPANHLVDDKVSIVLNFNSDDPKDAKEYTGLARIVDRA